MIEIELHTPEGIEKRIITEEEAIALGFLLLPPRNLEAEIDQLKEEVQILKASLNIA